MPQRGRKKRVLKDGAGDFLIMRVSQPDDDLPGGSLTQLPLPAGQQFERASDAKNWIRRESGDVLLGMEVMIVKVCDIMRIERDTQPRMSITCTPKITLPGRHEVDAGS